MKRFRMPVSSLLLILLLCLCAGVSAAPALEDNGTIAWIGPDNSFYLMNAAGEYIAVPMLVRDILSFSDSAVYCYMDNRQIYEINRNGTGSRLVENAGERLIDSRTVVQDGRIILGTVILSGVEAAVSDGRHICVISLSGDKRTLAVYTPDGKLWQGDGNYVTVPDGSDIPEPQSAVLVQDTLVVTGKDHSIWIGGLNTGSVQKLAASGNLTKAAAVINGKLYSYLQPAENQWIPESADALLPDQSSVYLPTPTPVPVVTAPPVAIPTATPSPAPYVTATPPSYDDGLIHYGYTGRRVRRMQQRLFDLGYPVGNVDGSYGQDTQLALNLFYDALGYNEHNYLTAKAEKLLYANNAPIYNPYRQLSRGMTGTDVRMMQQQLARLGYNPGNQDGIYGLNTVNAVSLFQDVCGLYPMKDEEPGEIATSELLMRLYAWDAPTRQPVPQVRWEQTADGWICYLNGVMATGWEKINKKWYYFSDSGIMQTGWLQKGNDRFYMEEDGALKTSWQKIDGSWYYFNTAGIMQRGWFEDKRAEKQKKKGNTPMWYWLDSDGKMVTGERVIDGKTEVFDNTGLWLYSK